MYSVTTMKEFRQIPPGFFVSVLFFALVFGYFLLFSKPVKTSESTSLPDVKQPETISDSFIPGGIKLSRNSDQTPLLSEAVLSENSSTPNDPLVLEEIHVRGRTLSLSNDLNLQPPPLGQESKALREFVFDLFDDVKLIGQVERLERNGDDRAVYYGTLTNVRGGDFILAYNKGFVAATFNTLGMGSFQLRPRRDGTVAAFELDLSRLPPCNAQLPISNSTGLPDIIPAEIRAKAALHGQYAASPPVEGGTYGGIGQQGGDGEGLTFTTIDILIVFTANAVTAAGGLDPLGAIIDAAFARANSVLINSEIGLRVRMVRDEQVAYNEVNTNTSLNAITNATGSFSSVPTWRNDSGADLVALVFNGGGGLAWVYNGSSTLGYSVSGISAIEATFIHEIGHNLGCLHDRENNATPNVYPYSHGWRFTPVGSSELRTIMSLAPGSRIPYFSNPDVSYMGSPTGVPIGELLQSNNAEVIRQTKASAAAFRAPNGNSPPSVVLERPLYSDPFKALDSVNLTASATDSDGIIQEVRFYRLMSDADLNFSDKLSTSLGFDSSSPYTGMETSTPAGFWTYAAVAQDNGGGIAIDTVSVAVAPHYRGTNLSMPGSKTRASLEGLNEAGRLVGFGHTGNTNATDTQAAYWENGIITLLNPLPGDTGGKALAVGQDGIIYGESISVGGIRRAVQWNNSTACTDISGVIASYSAQSAVGVDEQNRIYLVSGTDFRRFNNPGSTTTGTNQRWYQVVNTGTFATGVDYNFGPGAWRALRWNNGGTQLTPIPGYQSSWGFATNRSGAVFGFSSPDKLGWSSSTTRLTFWPAGSTDPVDLGTLGAVGGTAYDLNDWNEAVGSAKHPEDGDLAFIWKGAGSLVTLADIVLPEAGLKRDAQVINNRGQIAGTGFVGSIQYIFFLDPLAGLEHRYWLANHFSPAELEDANLTGDDVVLAGDGLSNLIKRGFGLDPRVPATAVDLAKLPQGTLDADGRYHFRYRRLRTPRDIDYSPQASLTLSDDSWNGNLLEQVGTTFIDDEFEEVELRTTFPVSSEGKAFTRVRLDR